MDIGGIEKFYEVEAILSMEAVTHGSGGSFNFNLILIFWIFVYCP